MGYGKENRLLTEEIQTANENMAVITISHYWVTQEQITVTIHFVTTKWAKNNNTQIQLSIGEGMHNLCMYILYASGRVNPYIQCRE